MLLESLSNRALLFMAALVVGIVEYTKMGEYCPELVAHLRSQLRLPPLLTNGAIAFEMADVSTTFPEEGDTLTLSNRMTVRIMSTLASNVDLVAWRKFEGSLSPSGTPVVVECMSHDQAGRVKSMRDILSRLPPDGFPRYIGYVAAQNCVVREFIPEANRNNHTLRRIKQHVDIARLVPQLVRGLSSLHGAGYLYGNLLPEDVQLIEERGGTLRLVFSLSPFRLPQQEAPLHTDPSADLYFCSISQHMRNPGSPGDDIERLMYVLIEMFYADLPWQLQTTYSTWLMLDEDGEATDLIQGGIMNEKSVLKSDVHYFAQNRIPDAFRKTLEYISVSRASVDYDRIANFFVE